MHLLYNKTIFHFVCFKLNINYLSSHFAFESKQLNNEMHWEAAFTSAIKLLFIGHFSIVWNLERKRENAIKKKEIGMKSLVTWINKMFDQHLKIYCRKKKCTSNFNQNSYLSRFSNEIWKEMKCFGLFWCSLFIMWPDEEYEFSTKNKRKKNNRQNQIHHSLTVEFMKFNLFFYFSSNCSQSLRSFLSTKCAFSVSYLCVCALKPKRIFYDKLVLILSKTET